MICALDPTRIERVILVGHKPTPVVFSASRDEFERLTPKPDGHYDREALEALARDHDRDVVMHDANVVLEVLEALPGLVHGCPPW
jgi:hypothetical protein